MVQFYIYQDEEKKGPYTVEELKDRGITSEILVWTKGMAQWQPAWQVGDLKPVIKKDATPNTPPPLPPKETAVPPEEPVEVKLEEKKLEEKPKKKSHWGCLIALLIFVLIIVVFSVSCPKDDKHKEVVSKEISTAVNNVISPSGGILGAVTNILTSGVVNIAVDQILTVDNYVVCSIGKINYKGKNRAVSLGILGNVYSIDSKVIEEKIKEYLPSDDD